MDSTEGHPIPEELIYISEWEGSPQVVHRHLGRYFSMFKTIPRIYGHWVDCACGSGYGTSLLAAMGATTVVGVDRNPGALAYAKAAYQSPRVQFLRRQIQNAHHWMPGKLDGVACIETLEHLSKSDQVNWVARAAKCLNLGGYLHVCCPLGDGGPNYLNPYHLHEPTAGELKQLLETYFRKVTIWTEDYLSTAGEAAVQAHATCTLPRRP